MILHFKESFMQKLYYIINNKRIDLFMKKAIFNKKLLFVFLIPVGALLSYTASLFPNTVETLYSTGFYKPIGLILSKITGIVPTSAAELILIAVAAFAIWRIIVLIIHIFKNSRERKYFFINFFINILVTFSIIYFCFILLWGFNYYRLPFSTISKLEVRPSSASELTELCESLIERANLLRQSVGEDSKGVMQLSSGYRDVFSKAYKGYKNASRLYPQLDGNYGPPKGVILSRLMSYTGITGVYFPFTGEANVNVAIPDSDIPVTACHEMAHQRGFAREDEANYIAYITCKMNPEIDFQYSGTLLALIDSTNALYGQDEAAFKELRSKYSEGLIRDLKALNDYWKQFEGPVNEVSNKINDTYLKANNQSDGVQSYGRMVDLLLAEYRKEKSR